MMNRKLTSRFTPPHYLTLFNLLILCLLLAACTQDEGTEQGNTLPDGEYPLQIGSVSITAESSEEPWTRVAENETDGMGSHWTGGERIGVRIGDNEEMGIYIINVDDAGNVTVTPETPVYWKNTQTAEVTAWYPAEDGNVYLSRQDRYGLTYVLRGTGTGNHQSPVTLQFKHQLAKVRVVTKGTADVGKIEIFDMPTGCNIQQGEIIGALEYSRLPMRRTTYQDDTECWEANVVPGEEIQVFIVSGTNLAISSYCEISPNITPEAGKVHTITITANREGTQTIDLANEDYEITGDGIYYFSGTANHTIRVTNGNPEIYLEDAQISVSDGSAIDIQGGSPTIHVRGNDNEVTSGNGAGIYVAADVAVTLTGRDRNDALTARGAEGGAGIGAAGNATVGSISISNVTLYAYGGARGTDAGAAAIGGGTDGSGSGGQTEYDVTVSNAAIHAGRGSSYASYIGAGGHQGSPAGYDIAPTVRITDGTVYDESGTEITQ